MPSAASASTDDRQDRPHRHCAAAFDAAVHEDNDAFAAKDAARYEAILNPPMIFWYDGVTTYGRDPVMATARANFPIPGWEWHYTILSETVYGCSSGIAVLDAHTVFSTPESTSPADRAGSRCRSIPKRHETDDEP